jgi:predicted phage gp36 major capsid-like protein
MKRVFPIFLTIFVAMAFISVTRAEKKAAGKAKDNPCLVDCKKENRKCLKGLKGAKKEERKAKIEECDKAHKDCRKNCDKPAVPAN